MEIKIQIEIVPYTERVVRESFRVPCELSGIHISVKNPADFPLAGFLAILDEAGNLRLQKMIAYGEQELGIGEKPQDNTIGAVPGRVNVGEWTLLFGNLFTDWDTYKGVLPAVVEIVITDERLSLTEPMEVLWMTQPDGVRMRNTFFDWDKIYRTGDGWYMGDFHTHTRLSDGKETVRNAMKKAVDQEMDFYVPTEHNLVHTGWTQTQLCIIPGVEITLPLGHFNLLGITERPSLLNEIIMTSSEEEMRRYMLDTITEANEKGWLVSVNHPFLHIWKWHLDEVELSRVQCMEIVNDPTYNYAVESNDKAISFLDTLWEDGHRIVGIGGSDSHNLITERYPGAVEPSVAGDPGTYVYCGELSPRKVLEATRAGHAVVTRHCRILPRIYGEKKEYLPGDEVTEGRITLDLTILDAEEKPVVYLVGNTESGRFEKRSLPVEKTEEGYFHVSYSITMRQQVWSWARMEVRDRKGAFMGYVNPVYAGRKQPQHRTFGEMKHMWGLD